MYVCTGVYEGCMPERAANMILLFTAIKNSYYTHTDWYIITIVQTSKLVTWQNSTC